MQARLFIPLFLPPEGFVGVGGREVCPPVGCEVPVSVGAGLPAEVGPGALVGPIAAGLNETEIIMRVMYYSKK